MCQTTDGLQAANGKLKPVSAPMIPGAESLRDGATTNTPNTIGDSTDTNTITSNLNKGHHESEQYYYECQTRSRNKGLFTADQNLNGNSAQFTRQNNNGNRRGLECPEERDCENTHTQPHNHAQRDNRRRADVKAERLQGLTQ